MLAGPNSRPNPDVSNSSAGKALKDAKREEDESKTPFAIKPKALSFSPLALEQVQKTRICFSAGDSDGCEVDLLW